MLLMIDNFDSFTYNLVDYFGKLYTKEILVFRNNAISIQEIDSLNPSYIVISPGPKAPKDAGISKEVIQHFGPKVPILGVCLGHQAIGEVYGATIIGAKKLMHGKTSFMSYINDCPLFKGLPNPFEATRYHSLAIDEQTIPESLVITARACDDGEIMGISHRLFPTVGVQFHPESICSPEGLQLLDNFLKEYR